MMKRSTRVGLLLLTGFLVLMGAQSLKAGSPVAPERWLDSLHANLWRMDMDSLGYTMKFTTLREELNKHGEVKKAEQTIGTIFYDEEDRRIMQVRNQEGEVTEERVLNEPVSSQEEEEEVSMNPFAAFNPENRPGYEITMKGRDSTGNPVLHLAPLEDGFSGDIAIDTSLWIPLTVSGAPNPFPKHVKSMTMDLRFEPDSSGANLMREMRTEVAAKFLLMNFRMRIHQQYSDFQRVAQ